jgi:hypothetical protein
MGDNVVGDVYIRGSDQFRSNFVSTGEIRGRRMGLRMRRRLILTRRLNSSIKTTCR